MSYRINARTKKNGTTYWRLMKETWANGIRRDEHIPTSQLLQHGLSPTMDVEEARTRVKQMNAQARLDKKGEASKLASLRQLAKREVIESAHLPKRWVEEFEQDFLMKEMRRGPNGASKYKKALSAWEYAKKAIRYVNLPQGEWFMAKRHFYGYFSDQATAPDYAAKVLRVLNMWGIFIALKTKSSFIPVPTFKGADRHDIANTHIDSNKPEKESQPLTEELLQKARGKLSEAQWRWLYVSLWFGLRPKEVDNLPTKSKIVQRRGQPALAVEQTKLSSVAREHRWKHINCTCKEQREALAMIAQGLDRPLVKTVKKYIGPGFTTYAGRKGFVNLMLSKGHELRAISAWMGHHSVDRTWRDYHDDSDIEFKMIS